MTGAATTDPKETGKSVGKGEGVAAVGDGRGSGETVEGG